MVDPVRLVTTTVRPERADPCLVVETDLTSSCIGGPTNASAEAIATPSTGSATRARIERAPARANDARRNCNEERGLTVGEDVGARGPCTSTTRPTGLTFNKDTAATENRSTR